MNLHTFLTRIILLPGLTLSLAVGACAPTPAPAPTLDVNALYTQAAATISVQISQTAQAAPSATPIPPSITPAPSATLDLGLQTATLAATSLPPTVPVLATSAVKPSPTIDPATAFGCYNATLLADLSVPYGSTFEPGNKFTKTWRVKNTGTCDWNRTFLVTLNSGDSFGVSSQALNLKIPAGGTAEISLPLTAPHLSGTITSTWRLTTETGKPFGSLLGVTIELPAAAAPTATGCLNSALLSDVTIPNGAELAAGDSFTKTWLVKNTGTCDWNSNFKITYVGGDLLGSDTTRIRLNVNPGATGEISLPMVAPNVTGQVISSWQLASDEGTLFGQVFTIVINLK